jgi:vitamin B12 transporter
VSFGPVKQISPSVTYKYLRSYLLSFGYTYASDKRIPYNPEHTIGAALDISWARVARIDRSKEARSTCSGSLLISAHYESVRYEDRGNFTELVPYFLLNAAVNQEINNNLTVFCSLRNILNTSYESFYAYPMPGITITLGMRLAF